MSTVLADSFAAFVALCEGGRTLEAIERFYADDVVVHENAERARVGREACLGAERDALAASVHAPTLRARARACDEVHGVSFVEWTIRFVSPEGHVMRLDEVARQTWSRGRIVEERFYYEGVVDEGPLDA